MDTPPLTDLRPCDSAVFYNDIPTTWCATGQPSEPPDILAFTSVWSCPKGSSNWHLKKTSEDHWDRHCRLRQTEPPPPDACGKRCGNPIQVESRVKIQKDFDIGLDSLRFDRTYTSSTGEWRHTFATRAWNLELNARANLPNNASPACFAGILESFEERVCLPYASNSDLGRTDAADWIVQRTDGRTVGISSTTGRSLDGSTRETARAITNAGVYEGLVVYDGRDGVEFFDSAGRLTRRSQLNGSGVLLTYLTPAGQKVPAAAPTCAGLSVGPGTAGNPSCATDIVTGRQMVFSYDSAGRLSGVTDPSGNSVSYQYNGPTSNGTYIGFDALTSVTYADQTERTYHYNEPSLTSNTDQPQALTGITDETNSRYAYFGYNGSGTAHSTSHADGIDSYTVAPSGWIVTDPLGRRFTFGSTTITKTASDGSVASSVVLPDSWRITLPSGSSATERRTYDAAGNLKQLTDYKGYQTRFEYDLTRNYEVLRIEAYGTARARWTSTAWHPRWRLPVLVAEPNRMTWSIYNGQPDPTQGNAISTCAPATALLDGEPIAVLCKRVQQSTTDATGQSGFAAPLVGPQRAWTYIYNEHGQLLSADGPRDDVNDATTYDYYAADDTQVPLRYRKGDLHTVTNALGHVTTYGSYNQNGQPLLIVDPNGVTTTLTYDPRHRLTSRTIGAEQTTFEYWPTGLLRKTTLPNGDFLEYAYDVAHRLTDIRDADGNVIHYTLDALGNRTAEEVFDPSSALSRTTTRVFDVLNRISQQIGAAGTAGVTTTYGYDSNSNQTSVIAPLGRNTTQVYDELNRLTRITDPLSGVTQYGYDARDQLISVTDPRGLVTSYAYNGLGDLEQQVSPDTATTTHTYDSAGNVTTSSDARNAVTTRTYDALNRVTTIAFSSGSAIDQTLTYVYDVGANGKGRLTQVSDNNHSLSWTYDHHGRVQTAAQTVGAIGRVIEYTYANGSRQSMTTPSGHVIAFGYTNGKVTAISVNGAPLVSDILYDPFGPIRQWAWSNGSLSVTTFDQDGKVTQIDSAGLNVYSYDDAFRIIGVDEDGNPASSWTYGYDALDRLESASSSGTSLGYTYDQNGNRLTATGGSPSTYSVSSSSNRLNGVTGSISRSYVYDEAGNALGDGAVTYTYNNAGRMASSTKAGVTTTYIYNALGQRVKKTTSGVSQYFVYDEAGHLIGEYDSSGGLIQEVVWLGDIPVATLRPNGSGVELFYIHTDHLNTPRKISRPTDNAVVWRWDSDPFGATPADEDPDGDGLSFAFNLRFPGQYWDAETGMHYNYYRDYDPATGRYVQSDPIGLQGGLNTYAYALNSPLSFSDPLGLDAAMCRAALRAAGGLVGGATGATCGCVLVGALGGAGGTVVGPGGTIAGAAAGCGAGGDIGGVAGAALGGLAGDKLADAVCKDEPDCSKATPWQLVQAGITDPHEFKSDYGARPNSRFDICACKDGSIVIKAVGGCGKPGPGIATGMRWK